MEKPANIGAYRFLPPVDALKKAVTDLRASQHPDLIVWRRIRDSAATSIPGRPKAGGKCSLQSGGGVPGVDAIVFGHSQQGTGGSYGPVTFCWCNQELGHLAGPPGFHAGTEAGRRLDRSPKEKPPDSRNRGDGSRARHPGYRETLSGACGTLPGHPGGRFFGPLSAALGRVEDTAIVDAVQEAQLYYSKADVSFTALFNPAVRVPQGQVTVRRSRRSIHTTTTCTSSKETAKW